MAKIHDFSTLSTKRSRRGTAFAVAAVVAATVIIVGAAGVVWRIFDNRPRRRERNDPRENVGRHDQVDVRRRCAVERR